MKKIIIAALLMCTVTVSYAQLHIERYSSDHRLVSEETTPNAMEWQVNDMDSETTTDDVLLMYRYASDGLAIANSSTSITAITIQEDTYSFEVENSDGSWYIVTFWYKKAGVIPMVAYQFSDGYIIYSGAVKY